MSAAHLAESGAPQRVEGGDVVQVEPHPAAPADPRDAFARALLAFAAEHDVAALALIGAEVMFPDYAGSCDAALVRDALSALCGSVVEALNESARSERPLPRLERMEAAAITMRDVARVLATGSHLLDALAAEGVEALKARGEPASRRTRRPALRGDALRRRPRTRHAGAGPRHPWCGTPRRAPPRRHARGAARAVSVGQQARGCLVVRADPSRARAVLRLVAGAPSCTPSRGRASPALDAALAATRDALSAAMLRAGCGNGQVTAAVALLGRAQSTRARADVLTLAAALGSLSVEASHAAHALTVAGDASDAWSDRADDGTRYARAAAVLLASLPRG